MNRHNEYRQASFLRGDSPAEAGSRAPQVATTESRAKFRRCRFPDCLKTAKPGGLCISHGGGKKCSVANCTTSMVSRGVCVAHGGGKRCQSDGCPKSAQSGGFCWIHGGGKKCGFEGCVKRAQSGGACISHGGGKRCRMDGCNKVVQHDGLCVNHGGHRKCLSMYCETKALANGYCLDHGGRTKCVALKCQKKAVCGDYCSEHHAAVVLSHHHHHQHQQQHHRTREDLTAYGCIPVVRNELPARSRLRSLSFATAPPWRPDVIKKEPRTEFSVGERHESEHDGGGSVDWKSRRLQRKWEKEDTPFEVMGVDVRIRCGVSRSVGERERLRTSESRQRRHTSWLYNAPESSRVDDVRRLCAVAACPRFAKVDGLCLLHRQRVHAQRWGGRGS